MQWNQEGLDLSQPSPLHPLSLQPAWQWASCLEEADEENSTPASQAPCHRVLG